MKLTRLRLIGFKSFVEPTDFLIEPGLTGVVGPNGCGKSNLVEALRWVMGETSHKSMRAAEMDDVIFAGNNNRPPRNTAEVAIQMDNDKHEAPAQFNEHDTLDISRRIEREKGSLYRINGREVRARDVMTLFADASTGSRSPALVHQGRIGEIIQAKPEQRRRVLEEAAGISGLHARRHEAELRLKAAEANLLRVEDVVKQLSGQIDGLKRQARQAIRYRNLSAEVRKVEATLYYLRWLGANAEVLESDRAKDLSVRTVAEATIAQTEAGHAREAAAEAVPPLRDTEARAGAALQRLIMARDALDAEETRARERLAELDRRLAQFEADVMRERALVADAEAALAQLAEEEETLRREAHESAERRSGVDTRVAEADAVVSEAEKTFGELTGQFADLTARRNQLTTTAREQAERIARMDAELANIEAGLTAANESRPDVAALAESVEAAQAAVGQGEENALAAEAAHEEARKNLEAARIPLAEAERAVQRLDTEAKTLMKLLAVETQSMWPPVIDSITVNKGYEIALGAALGDDLDAPVDQSHAMRWAGAAIDPSDPTLPEGVEPLAKHVEAPPELARRLNQIGVVEAADGARLAALLKPGQRLVSRDGDLWRWDGFAADAHAPTGAARRLAQRSRLADIDGELAMARATVEVKRASVEMAQSQLAAAGVAEGAARDNWRSAQREADSARELHASAERELARNAARISALTEAQSRLVASRDEAKAAADVAETGLAELPPSADLEAQLTTVKAEIEGKRTELAEIRAEAQALAREAELADRRLNAIGTDRQAWNDRRERAHTQIATLDTRSGEARQEREGLADAPALFEEKRRALITEVETAEAARREAADRLTEAENALSACDRTVRAALEALGAAREEAARAEERVDGAKRRLTDVAHEIQEMLEVEPDGVAGLAGIEPNMELPDVDVVEQDLERLRRDRERLGAVNLRAEEELVEIETQHNTLTAERDDLVEAIKRLRQGIISLNKEARERLLSSFANVNTQFQRLFTELFGGGTAELQLIEADDPLEAGLEIFAKPPGKKPATLSLLSGGEQALTALALIFAVFLTNPAPICVLDEVDAPLDDHNVERFCDLLDEMGRSTDTRFVIITHNPITMARMNRLFGVTMAERGVSQLVSVDLEAAVRIRDSAA
ncbi:chromosome segregation protein SMC [Rhodoplanes sp. Z2-YC6860]|uniref:chromosome segregation protein SMC n=1 Tax=Rhodoplanes sp. Z2-YC6860 TaxID=674703 RepID=UPI00078DC886|nr:chromosome segregation protein SMC [Rhodoplanes sp. Z2-YC6860]AMN40930.1 chromosome segregation protein SMC [Rhodoplanes sp. Z2-YC6860]